jgi:signal transduction histidine kinase
MAHGAFQHRSGRVISLARLSLAIVFLIAIWADPSQPSAYPMGAYAVLAGYLAVAASYLAATWTNWWLEHRLALFAHLFDIALFGIMVTLTDGYTSPFYTFFVFLILSATIRWSWKETAATAAVVILVFLVAGMEATRWNQVDPDVTRIVIRSTNLIILSLVLIWFSLNQRSGLLQYVGGGETGDNEMAARGPSVSPPVRGGLDHAVARTGAARAAMVWWDEDEPWVHVATLCADRFSDQRFAPEAFGSMVDERLAGRTFLFDAAKGHVLAERRGSAEAMTGIAEPLDPGLRSQIGCVEGLAVPVATETHGALFVLCEIPGLCADDLQVGKRLGEEFAAALRQSSVLGMFEAAAADRTRLAISRDLHDTVVQLLAGTSLRLQGVRRAIAAGRDVDEELKTLQDALTAEQHEMRMLIGGLRSVPEQETTVPLRDLLAETAEKAGRQWAVDARIETCADTVPLGKRLAHEVDQLVREAIANAAKHARASAVLLTARRKGRDLALIIHDNGCGFEAAGAGETRPRSLEERVQALGGSLALDSTASGSTVTIILPLERSP